MPTNSLLHIVIPVYNQEEYFTLLLDSLLLNLGPYILNNTVKVSIVDDASQGDTIKMIVQKHANYNLDYHRNSVNLGLLGNFKKCVEIADGKYFWMPGADDVIQIKNVARLLEHLEEELSPMILFGVSVIDYQGNSYNTLQDTIKRLIAPRLLSKNPVKIESRKVLARVMIGNFIYFPAVFWQTSLTKDKQFRDGYGTCLDLDLIARILLIVPEVTYWPKMEILQYRRHAQSHSSISSKVNLRLESELQVSSEVASEALLRKWWLVYFMARMSFTARLHRFLVQNSFIRLRS